jgi:hypothetical protein
MIKVNSYWFCVDALKPIWNTEVFSGSQLWENGVSFQPLMMKAGTISETIETNMADHLRRLHCIQSPLKLQILYNSVIVSFIEYENRALQKQWKWGMWIDPQSLHGV